ncbi:MULTISPECIES: efflux transporter outer membrane subunit [Chromobacterium]|nr:MULTISPECIES: efflux transporter outer membrane subunit [Chromobacterium]
MKPFPATLALAGALMLSACAQMDAVKPASQLKTPPALNAPWAGMPSADWWRQWRDPQLEQLIRLALQDNPGLRGAEARLRQAQALSEASAAAAQPQINAQWQSTRQLHAEKNLVPPAGHGNYDWQTRAAVNLSYDLDAWGRERQALSASLSDAQMAAADARLSALNLETAVIRAYLQLSEQYQQKDLAVAALQQQQALLDLSLRRKAAGLTAQPEVEQQRGKLPAARAQLEQIDERIATLGNQLAALSGQTPDTQNRPRRPTLRLDQPLDPLAAVPAQLLGRRPDLSAQRWRVEAEAARIKVARAAFYPNINISAFVGYQAIGFADLLSPAAALRGFAPAISLPIFEGGRLRGQLRAQTAAYDQAVESYNAVLINALSETASAIVRARSADQQSRQADQALDAASRERALAEQAYRAGLNDQSAVRQLRLSELSARQKRAQAQAQRLDSYAALMAALGGGIEPQTPIADGEVK